MTLSRMIARPLLASTFLVGGVNALRNVDQHAQKATPVTDRIVPLAQKAAPGAPIPTDAKTWVRINAAVQIGAGLAFATGRAPRLSASLLALSLVPTTLAGHSFWAETDPTAKRTQFLGFTKNASMLGGLMIAAGDTEGQPGLAWRAQRATKDVRREARTFSKEARREAKHLAGSARREAKLARAQLT
ncbi:MAG: DoxX family protein [Nocardioides sp.]|nr:DoxX family protein [Nocardioides sp.]